MNSGNFPPMHSTPVFSYYFKFTQNTFMLSGLLPPTSPEILTEVQIISEKGHETQKLFFALSGYQVGKLYRGEKGRVPE